MMLNCTLAELNAFMKEAFSEKALDLLRLEVNIEVRDLHDFVSTYPDRLPQDQKPLYDYAAEQIRNGVGKIDLIKFIRERTGYGLKEGKEFVERWFPKMAL